ncbi:MAG: hypothetical protein J6P03_03395 [Opitutales bacterium]|nr:hypothetical protein [Opitutales bacterium]
MEITGKAHCFFEQSGTFKREFAKLGIPAADYDLANDFGETDFQLDLFAEIEKAWHDETSVFDAITPEDLIIAFFPCTYFCGSANPLAFRLDYLNYRKLQTSEKIGAILLRAQNRERNYETLIKFVGVCLMRGLRLIVENPWQTQGFLTNNFLQSPSIIDTNRRERGDDFRKPTGFWFFGCAPTKGHSQTRPSRLQRIGMHRRHCERPGQNNRVARSMISSDYARNFICDFVLGVDQGLEAPLFCELENRSASARLNRDE